MAVKDVGSRIRRRGLMLVLSSPSGAGKSTIARNLHREDPGFELSVSVTTRPRRGSEIDGVHYRFVSQREFDSLRDSDALLEWAEVHGNFYATPREPAEKAMAEGRDMLFDIDWQGAKQLKEKMRGDIVSIFILPPSMKELKARLKRRAEDQEAVIETRLKNARTEIEHWTEYDFVVDQRRSRPRLRRGARDRHRRAPAPRPPPGAVRFRVRIAGRENSVEPAELSRKIWTQERFGWSQMLDDLHHVVPADFGIVLTHSRQHDFFRPFGFPPDESRCLR